MTIGNTMGTTADLTSMFPEVTSSSGLGDLECDDPGVVEGAARGVTGQQWAAGTSVTFTCLQNYQHLSGNLSRVCLPSSTWSGVQPICSYVGAMVSAEMLIAVTASLAGLVLLLLPIEFLRYKLKQARGREILKIAKSARKKMRAAPRQNPFMGTPAFSRPEAPLPVDTDALKKGGPPTHYFSNSHTAPHFLPKLRHQLVAESESRKKHKKRKKKNFVDSSDPSRGKVNPLYTAENTETDDAVSKCGDVSESHAMRELNGTGQKVSSLHLPPSGNSTGVYENHVDLEDELQQNIYSLGQHKLPPLSPHQSPVNIIRQQETQPRIELEGRDLRAFVV